MSISNFPTSLQNAIQQGFLEREFKDGIATKLAYRAAADKEPFQTNMGEILTKTKMGLKAPATTPLTPANNTNLDNGLTPSTWGIEQYSITLNQYADTIDLNLVTQKVGIADQFLKNARVNGIQSAQTVDELARNTLFNSYLGGNSRVRTTLGSPGAAVAVDDIRGFQYVWSATNNAYVPVSSSNPMTVVINGDSYTLNSAVADTTNVTTAFGGISGVLTFSGNVTVADATAANQVLSSIAPAILRPSGRATTAALTAADLLTMSILLDAKAYLERNNVPTIDGYYNCYCDPVSVRQLFADPDFKVLFQGQDASREFRQGKVVEILGIRFMTTTEAPTQSSITGSFTVRRPIMVGEGALIEGEFVGNTEDQEVNLEGSIREEMDGIVMITRPPLDRLGQIVAQSWRYIGGFTTPSDITVKPTIVPTASNAGFKRAVVIETAG